MSGPFDKRSRPFESRTATAKSQAGLVRGLTVAGLRVSCFIASASVLALGLAAVSLATVSLADGGEGDGVLEQESAAQTTGPPQNASGGAQSSAQGELDAVRAQSAARSAELGAQSARLSVTEAALRDQTLRADILTCLVVALMGALLAVGLHARGARPRPAHKRRPAERAKGPRRPSTIDPDDPALP